MTAQVAAVFKLERLIHAYFFQFLATMQSPDDMKHVNKSTCRQPENVN